MAAISLRNVGLAFPLMDDGAMSFRSSVARRLLGKGPAASRVKEIEALKQIDLELRDGDRLGLIGVNGAGKSTLLRVMAGILATTHGDLLRSGSVVTMFDLSYGMDEEASGLENIDLAGTLLGLSMQEIRAVRDEVCAFSELGDALSRPIKTYSAGMRVRLAFGLLTSLRPDILLIDEIIGVGDSRFMKKASDRLKTQLGATKITVVASHADTVLRDFCSSAVVMKAGEIVYHGSVDEALAFYNGPGY